MGWASVPAGPTSVALKLYEIKQLPSQVLQEILSNMQLWASGADFREVIHGRKWGYLHLYDFCFRRGCGGIMFLNREDSVPAHQDLLQHSLTFVEV